MGATPKRQPDADVAERTAGTQIGSRLKAARLARRMTLTEVAVASRLTKGFVSKLERDLASASVASLIRLCEVLEIPVSSLFQASAGELVKRGDYPLINFGGDRLSEYLLTPRGEQRLQAILSEIEPGGGSGDELYTLPAEVEFALVLGGTLAVQIEDREVLLEEGDALTFSAESRHGFRNPDNAAATRVLWVFTPALPVAPDDAG